MKRKLLVLLCLVALVAFVFSSCDIINGSQQDGNTPGSTDNTGNNTGNNNEGNDGTDNGGGSTDDGNDDNTDDTDDCEHTFSESWTTNKQSHWHAATCDHTSEKGDLGNHSDVNEDGRCDVCNYYVSHTHTYADEWSYDEAGHWHAATCTHNNVQGSYAEHVDANANGECDDCGAEVKVEIDVDSPEAIINQIIGAKGGVATSNIREQAEFISLVEINGIRPIATRDAVGVFKFGANSMYCNVATESYQSYVRLPDGSYGPVTATNSYEKWQEYMNSETVFGVFANDGGELELDGTATIDTIGGYLFTVSTLASAYGPENILLELYKLSGEETAGNYVWQYDETTGVYAFGYDYLQINRDVALNEEPNVNYYVVGVAFTHNENYVLTNLAIQCQCYTNSLEDERDHDYTYDDTTGTITMKPEGEYAADTYTFVVTQTAGERTYVNENPRSKFLPETFELYTDSERTLVADKSITVSTNGLVRLYLGAFLPEGTSISFNPEALTAHISDGTNVYDSTIVGVLNETLYLSHNPIDENVTFRIYKPGTYTLTVSIGTENDQVVTINVTDGGNDPNANRDLVEEIEIDINAMTSWDQVTENHVISFTATESGNYTFVLPAECGAYDKAHYDEYYGTADAIGAFLDPFAAFGGDYNGGEFTVFIEAGTTYEFYLGSFITQSVVIECYRERY